MSQENAPPAASAPEPAFENEIRVPAMRVHTGEQEIAAFLAATGGTKAPGFVPLTFPFRWLALPAVRDRIVEALGGTEALPVHEAQEFTYLRDLELNSDYLFAVTLRRSENPARLTLRAEVCTQSQEPCLCFETVLRIVPLAPAPEHAS